MEEYKNSVAIIGISGLFPEADTLEQLYQNLKNGVDSVREVADSRLADVAASPYRQYLPMGYLDQVDAFDHPFFNLSKRESELMNPEQRLILQLACQAIEHAGYRLQQFQNSPTAVYLGGGSSTNYVSLIQAFEPTVLTGNMNAITAGRIAYALNLNGPALMIDTSCSSTLVAIYEACQKLIQEEVDYALAGGIYVIINFPDISEATGEVGIMSADGRSKTFAAGANGTGGGEGGGILLLKRLDKALADHDTIHAVIRGGAINHDGNRSAGLTAPSLKAQTEVIKRAWQNAAVPPETISYVEAHGTGTKLGDPIEFEALTEAFRAFSDHNHFCAVGSIKTNFGHLNNAAGIAGVIKSVLSLKYHELFPSLHYHRPNPFIDIENTALQVNTQLRTWEANGSPRRCGVSSFGLSGTNAHLILEEAPPQLIRTEAPVEEEFILKITAKTPTALRAYVQQIHAWLQTRKHPLPDCLYTLNHGRDDYAYRICLTATSETELLQKLKKCYDTFDTQAYMPIREDKNAFVVLLASPQGIDSETFGQGKGSHYAFYDQSKQWGMPIKTIIATGTGRIIKQVIVDGLPLEQAEAAIREMETQTPEPIDIEKLKKAVKSLEQSGKPFFIEMGGHGVLSEQIQTILSSGSSASVVTWGEPDRSMLTAIAESYVQGLPINWDAWYAHTPCRKVEAPTYPFEKIRCWVAPPQIRPEASGQTAVEDWFYDLRWEKAPLLHTSTEPITQRTLLLLLDEAGLGETLATQLEAQGNHCIRVQAGNVYAQITPNTYTIDLSAEADYIRLEQEIAAHTQTLDGLLLLGGYGSTHLWDAETLEMSVQKNIYSPFFLLKAFQKHLKRHVYVTIVASSGGWGEALLAEYPLLKINYLELDATADTQVVSQQLLTELAADDTLRFVRYQDNERYVHALVHTPPVADAEAAIRFVDGGVYVVTGGASGIGFEIAKYISQQKNVHLIILGQTILPDKEHWKEDNLDEKTRQYVARLQTLEEAGATVDYYAVNLGDGAAVREVFEQIGRQVSKIHGIIHSAGVSGNWEPLSQKKIADFTQTLAPKVHGTIYLDTYSQSLVPDFFICFSSLNAVVAQKNSMDYAVANAFLNSYAAARRGTTRFLSISWPGWHETGMSLARNTSPANDPLKPIATKDGLRAFELALNVSKPNVWIANVDLSHFAVNPYFVIETGKNTADLSEMSISDESIDANATPVEKKIIRIWREVLRADSIQLTDDFFELGGHSLNGAQVINRIEREWGIKLEIDDLFDNGTVSELAACVEQRLAVRTTTSYTDITPVSQQSYYEVSHAQRRLWVLHQMKEEQTTYNIANAFCIKRLQPEAFSRAFDALVERHESLRTTFLSVDGQPYQQIHEAATFGLKLAYTDLRQQPTNEQTLKAIAHQATQTVFDLEHGPLVQVQLVQWTDTDFLFVYVMHHIISDGWSMEVLQQELMALYHAFLSGQPHLLTPLRIQYKDFAAWHRTQLSGTSLEAHQAYWLEQFSGEIPVLPMPTDFPRPSVKTFAGDIIRQVLDKSLCDELQQFSQQKGVSLFMTLQAIIKTLLYRYTGQEDMVVGTVEAGRTHADLENQIGYYVNTLALRTRFSGEESFDTLLKTVKENTLAAFEHKQYPFDVLVEELGVERNMSRTPLFDVSLVLQNFSAASTSEAELEVSNLEMDITISKLDMNLVFFVLNEGLLVHIEYATDLFTETRIYRLIGHLEQLCRSILKDSSQPLHQLTYLTKAEQHQLRIDFNQTQAELPSLTMPQLFEQVAAQHSDRVAIEFYNQTLTYQELNTQTDQLANYLITTYAIRPEEPVGLLLNRSEQMIVGILGILKAGGAFVPIDPTYPEDRKAYILADAHIRVLLTEMDLMFDVPSFEGELCVWETQPLPINGGQKREFLGQPCGEGLAAYLIYTSGSTGKPKGVMVEHQGNVNMALDQITRFGITPDDKVLQFASFSFDASVYEVCMALYSGATLVMADKLLIDNPDKFLTYLADKQVTVATLPPVYLAMLDKSRLQGLRILVTAGEAANVSDAVACSQFCTYYNAYGPTEASVCVSTHQVTEADAHRLSIPIGSPIQNMALHLLDAHGELVPIGVEGEICMAGVGLARGYLNQEELTAQAFRWHEGLQTQLYYSGDIGKRLENGEIEFVGRKDNQLKIRGYRIEPGEIAAVIASHPGVQDAFVLPRHTISGDSAQLSLVAILTPTHSDADAQTLLDSVRAWCKTSLPVYMLPSVFRLLPELPQTVQGKVDKAALLRWEETQTEELQRYVPPANELEAQLAAIWEEVLGKTPVGRNDDFFELGGHSLKATQVVSRIHQDLGARIELGSVFSHPTIAELADLIVKNGVHSHFESIPQAAAQEFYPLSHAQRRLWVLSQFEENKLAYLIPTAFRLEGELHAEAFSKAFDTLVERYEVLRTTFTLTDDGPQQQIHEAASFGLHLETIDLQHEDDPQAAATTRMTQEATLPFDLERGPLVRATLLCLGNSDYRLLLTLHHIVTDGWSIELLTHEMFALYNAFRQNEENPLPPLRIQYKDYSVWQHEQLTQERLKKQQTYWLNQFSGELPVLELPADQKRPERKTYSGDHIELPLNETISQQLKALSHTHNASLFSTLLASVYAFLFRYSGQQEMILGTTLAGRSHKDLENQVGFFINTLAFRNTVLPDDTFRQLLKRVWETTVDGFENQEYPFDRLIDELNLVRDVSRFPLFDILVELVNVDMFHHAPSDMAGLAIEPCHADYAVSKFDISFRFAETHHSQLVLNLEFNTDMYSRNWMERLATHYSRLLEKLVTEPDAALGRLTYLSEPEINRLLHGFNATQAYFPANQTVVDLFAEQVHRTPDAIALVFEDRTWTYRQLDEASNQIAEDLKNTYAIQPGDRLPLMMPRSDQMIINLWGILKTGAAYVPIDPEQPQNRIEYMWQDSGLPLPASPQPHRLAPKLSFGSPPEEGELDHGFSKGEPNESSAAHLFSLPFGEGRGGVVEACYVIYTSGSTGQPKGVEVEHRSVVNLSAWLGELIYMPHSQPLTALLTASINFDASVQQLFAPLLNGSRLVIIPEVIRRDPNLYIEALIHYQVEVIDITPSFLTLVLDALKTRTERPPLRYTLVGGEALREETGRDYEAIFGPDSQLINVYGITECTVNSTFERVNERRSSSQSIGKPLSNTEIYVLDAQQELVPVGVPGELYMGGVGVSRGYLNRPELTAERFIENPFKPGERLYRTGDLGRWLPEGTLEYIGRNDFQVKIRGFRIETGEVEHVLLQHPMIEDTLVMARTNAAGEAYLAAYFTHTQLPDLSALRIWLGTRLPHYMLPTFLVPIDSFPLNTSGKIDRKALPDPDMASLSAQTAYVAPGNEVETILVTILEELLQQTPIGIRDHFFEIGGNSLTAARFFRRIQEQLPGAIKMSDIFVYDTIEALATHIITTRQATKPELETAEAEVGEKPKKFKKVQI